MLPRSAWSKGRRSLSNTSKNIQTLITQGSMFQLRCFISSKVPQAQWYHQHSTKRPGAQCSVVNWYHHIRGGQGMSHSQSLADGISVISGPWEAMKPYCGCGAKAHPNDKVACPPNQGQAHKPSAVFQRLTQYLPNMTLDKNQRFLIRQETEKWRWYRSNCLP